MNVNLLSLFAGERKPSVSLLEYLNGASFDVLIGIDLNRDHYRFIYNIEEKYPMSASEGGYRQFHAHTVDRLVHEEDRARYGEAMDPDSMAERLEQANPAGALCFQYRIRNLYGDWQWVEQYVAGGPAQGLPEGVFYCYTFDIQNLKNREAGNNSVHRDRRVLRDPLTGLLREKDFFNAAQELLADTSVNWMMVAIDLEEFKLFNEWYGRDAGDQVLARIGEGLNRDAEACDGLAGYMGNDDFCFLVPAGRLKVEGMFERIHAVITHYGVSIGFLPAFGISYSNGNREALTLFDQAALAGRHAKKDFRDRIRTFDPSMSSSAAEDYRLLSDFQQALKEGEITFYLQPQCRALNGKIVGAESLARWVKKDGTILPPKNFVPILERYGFIPDLDEFIWEEVCKWQRSCLERKLPLITVSVNVSQVDIFTLNVPDYLERLLARYGLPHSALKVEITESAWGEDSEKVRGTVQELRDKGFLVLMDDFGSGYSSLNMLHDLSIDVIKMDANFLRLNELNERKGIHILESMVNMAKTMGLPIIVEGVETREQNEYLMSLGCRYIQGFYFYRPMDVKTFERLILDPENVEAQGFQYKANEEFHVREFLNDTVYSDSMLNNILGPTAIYSWQGDRVDIIRFNQQFYLAVNDPDFHQRLEDIGRFMPPADGSKLLRVLEQATQDRLNGASGVMTFSRSDGGITRFMIHFYFLREAGDSRHFYGSVRDVTEISNLNRHMALISRYSSHCVIFLVRRGGALTFEVAANGLEKEWLLTRDELERELNDGAFYRRVRDEDRESLYRACVGASKDKQSFSASFGLYGKDGRLLRLFIRSDYVDDEDSDVLCILLIRNEEE